MANSAFFTFSLLTFQGIDKSTVPIRILSRTMNKTECAALNCEQARFGFSIANVGDIDKDGFEGDFLIHDLKQKIQLLSINSINSSTFVDIAVGAPYEGQGAVYIFRGAAHGIVKEYSQRIYAADLQTARPLTTFGYSLSGGIDMDKNYYSDLAIGAFGSDKLVILRSRPVIHINAVILSIPERIKPDMDSCPSTGIRLACFFLRLCFQFSAEPRDR